jgi:hypothetical protein
MPRTVHLLVTIELDADDDRTAEDVRVGVEQDLSADLADVVLLAHTGTDHEPTADPAGRQRADDAARKRTRYLAAVVTALMRNDPAVQPYLSPVCPECGQLPEPEDGIHIVLGAAVVIGCEGYWVINPNVIGIPSPNWQPQD